MDNMNNPYGCASASPKQSQSTALVATKKRSSSSVRRDDVDAGGGVGVESWADDNNDTTRKRSIIKRNPKSQVNADGMRVMPKPEKDPRDALIADLRADLEKLRKICTCVVCQDLLFEPYFFQCGHVYCYGVGDVCPRILAGT